MVRLKKKSNLSCLLTENLSFIFKTNLGGSELASLRTVVFVKKIRYNL